LRREINLYKQSLKLNQLLYGPTRTPCETKDGETEAGETKAGETEAGETKAGETKAYETIVKTNRYPLRST